MTSQNNGNATMHPPKANWSSFNPWTVLLTLGPTFIAGAVAWGALTNKVEGLPTKVEMQALSSKVENLDRDNQIQNQNDQEIRQQLAPLTALQYSQAQTAQQVAEHKAQLVEVNKRIDRVVESLGVKLDMVIETVNGVKSDVRVLTQEVKSMSSRPMSTAPTSFRQP